MTIARHGRERTIHLLQKVPLNFAYQERDAAREVKIQRLLRSHGIPTLATMRRDPADKRILYTTDLTEGGKKSVSGHPMWQDDDSSEHIDQTIADTITIARQCSQAGLSLFEHAFYFTRDKETGETNVVLGDCKFVRTENALRRPMEYYYVGDLAAGFGALDSGPRNDKHRLVLRQAFLKEMEKISNPDLKQELIRYLDSRP